MRRALGLQGPPSADAKPTAPATASIGSHSSQPQRRRFVRDGEIPVTVVHREPGHDESTGTNQLYVARQALRAQTAAREEAERSLAEAQATVRDLQTKLAHERLAKDEIVQRAESDRQAYRQTLATAQEELAVERAARETLEGERDEAVAERQAAEERLTQMACQQSQKQSEPVRRSKVAEQQTLVLDDADPEPSRTGKVRKRGRPADVVQTASDVVEWWVPGWKERYR